MKTVNVGTLSNSEHYALLIVDCSHKNKLFKDREKTIVIFYHIARIPEAEAAHEGARRLKGINAKQKSAISMAGGRRWQ